jgi:hypothetical protein
MHAGRFDFGSDLDKLGGNVGSHLVSQAVMLIERVGDVIEVGASLAPTSDDGAISVPAASSWTLSARGPHASSDDRSGPRRERSFGPASQQLDPSARGRGSTVSADLALDVARSGDGLRRRRNRCESLNAG